MLVEKRPGHQERHEVWVNESIEALQRSNFPLKSLVVFLVMKLFDSESIIDDDLCASCQSKRHRD